MTLKLSVLAIVLAIIDGVLIHWIWTTMFSSWDELWDAMRFWFTPDIISAINGQYWEDHWAELKLGIALGGTVALIVSQVSYIASKLG